MENANTKRPEANQEERIQYPWKNTHSLDDCTFIYKGRSVPGSKLAELLGMTADREEKQPEAAAA